MTNPQSQNDILTYHTLDAMCAMTLPEVEALWELVPTDRQRLYRAIYDRTRRDEGAAGSDALEAKMVDQLIQRYNEKGLVPVGSYWVPTPQQIRDAAQNDADYVHEEIDEFTPKTKKPSPVVMLIGVGCVLVFAFLLLRGAGSGRAKTAGITTGTASRTPTATLMRTYTPTPLALDAQDAIIRGGNQGSSINNPIYPVNLRVHIKNEDQPRIFVVQRRIVNTAEWLYENNPDVASYIAGLTVHPVLGIPWSPANDSLFQEVEPGSNFTVQMNTGVALRFICTERLTVSRSDASIFGQDKPGLTLVLIGKTSDNEIEDSGERRVLLADYVPGSETGVAAALLPTSQLPTPAPSPTLAQRIDVQIISITTQNGRIMFRLRVFNGRFSKLKLDENAISLTYGYIERPVGPPIASQIKPVWIEPGQAADLSLTFAWRGEPFAMLGVLGEYSYALTLR